MFRFKAASSVSRLDSSKPPLFKISSGTKVRSADGATATGDDYCTFGRYGKAEGEFTCLRFAGISEGVVVRTVIPCERIFRLTKAF